MPTYSRIFAVVDVAEAHETFIQMMQVLEQVARVDPAAGTASLRLATRAYRDFNRNLNAVAASTAVDAKRRILSVLALRQKRPNTAMGPHLRGAIIARPLKDVPLATGSVGVADIAKLDSVVNPFGPQYGPYWRAIELGTRRHVGRSVSGAFFGAGLGSGPFKPNPGDFRAHPIFLTSAQGKAQFADLGFSGGMGKQGGAGGRKMKIRRAIDPQFFIKTGSTLAANHWRREIARVQTQAMLELRAISLGLP